MARGETPDKLDVARFRGARAMLAAVGGLALFVAVADTSSGDPARGAMATAATTRVSVSSGGRQGDLASYAAGISANGRYVAFSSESTNLVLGDTNARSDVFVHDRLTGRTTRVSVTSTGRQAAPTSDPFGGSRATGISGDGRYVPIVSDAPNLVAGDTNGVPDIFVHDRRTGRTTRIDVSSSGLQANGPSDFPAISADGRYITFASGASNLVRGDTNHAWDVFVHDRMAGTTRRVSVSSSGGQANRDCEEPVISDHGRYVTFATSASNLVRSDTNGLEDIFVHDRASGRTTRVSITSGGHEATGSPTHTGSNAPSISAHGRFIAFHSDATNLVPRDTNGVFDIFVHDRATGRTSRVSVGGDNRQANAESLGPESISAHGRYVAFTSLASNLVAGDANDITDVFVRDRHTGHTILFSLSSTGHQGSDSSWIGGGRAFSAGGGYIVFSAWASNLVPRDTNGWPDVFVRGLRSR